MVKQVALLLLLAVAASKVDLSQSVSITGSVSQDIRKCPITYYGHKYKSISVKFEPNLKICFKNSIFDPEQNCLLLEDGGIGVRLNAQTVSATLFITSDALKDISTSSQCYVYLQVFTDSSPYMNINIYNFGPQAAIRIKGLQGFETLDILNITAKVADQTVDSWFMNRTLTDLYRDISATELADPENCNITITTSTKTFSPFHLCGPHEFCVGYSVCLPLLPICTVSPRVIVDFFSNMDFVHDRCAYSLVKPQGSSDFELLAVFKERRFLGMPFLDYLILRLNEPGVIIYLEQGGRVRVDNEILTLNATAQVFHGVEIWKDETGVAAKMPFSNLTVFFNGYTAKVTGYNDTVGGLCGNLAQPNKTTSSMEEFSPSYSDNGCNDFHFDTDFSAINCTWATAHCKRLLQAPFTDCHDYTRPEPYVVACANILCSYPAVDHLPCQLLENYAQTCSLRGVKLLDDWRTTVGCSASPQVFCEDKHCMPNEFCGVKHGGTRCLCRAIFASKNIKDDTLGQQKNCTQNSGSVSLLRCLLEDKGVNSSSLHLNDKSCTGSLNSQTGMLTFRFNSSNTCGTKVERNNSQVIFQNTITTGNSSTNNITRQSQFVIDFSCYYTEPDVKTVGFRIKDSSVVQQIESGFWNYTLMMNAYTDSSRTDLVGNTEVLLNQKIYVELKTEGLDKSMVVLVTDSCWATNQPSPDDTLEHFLIMGGCPDDETVMMEGNGNGTSNFFSFNMFEFTRKNNEVYLHCKLELCPKQSNSCAPNCSRSSLRFRRSYKQRPQHQAFITMTWSK